MWSDPRASAAVDCREMDREDEREETGGKWLWRKARQPWKQGDTAESQVGGGTITIASLSPHTSFRQLNNREAGPSKAWHAELQSRAPARGPLCVSDVLGNGGLQAREPSKCLSRWSYRERLAKEASDRRPQEAKKETLTRVSCGGGSPCPFTLGTARAPQAKQLRHLHAQLSLGQSCHRQKKVSMWTGSLPSCPDFLRLGGLWPARLLCQGVGAGVWGGVLQARALERIGQHWLLYPSRAPYFLLPWPPPPPST